MRVMVYLPLVWSLALAALAPRLTAGLGTRLTPRLLTAVSVTVAASWCWSLVVLAGMTVRSAGWWHPLGVVLPGRTGLLPPTALTAAGLPSPGRGHDRAGSAGPALAS